MASSLSQQLAQVQSYNAAQLGNAKTASKAQYASYLFPAHVASAQDLQTLQSLGANGWEELSQNDNTFSKWDLATGASELLFGESSRALDRLMKSKEENEELDRIIGQFLQLVGGNLLDRSTGKCIEWLVRRFRVHEYNVEDILSTFLPYHETQEFARMLQLLDLKNKPHFAFLLPIQKRAAVLSSSVLISTLLGPSSSTSSLSTLRWVVGLLSPKTVARFRRPNYALQTFWVSTIIRFCSRLQGKGDDTIQIGSSKAKARNKGDRNDDYQQYLTVLLPASVDAATTTQLGLDCQIGGCLALCSIATCFPLSSAAKRSVISSLADAKMDVEKVQKAYMIACACICMGQEDEDVTSEVNRAQLLIDGIASQKLANKASMITTIRSLCESYEMTAFINHLTSALFIQSQSDNEEDRSIAVKVLDDFLHDDLIVSDALAARVVTETVTKLAKDEDKHNSETYRMLASLYQRRPDVVDKAASKVNVGEQRETADAISKIMKQIKNVHSGSSTEDENLLQTQDPLPSIKDDSITGTNSKKISKEAQYSKLFDDANTVSPSECSAIVSTEGESNVAAITYKMAVAISFTDPTLSSKVLTTLFSRLGDVSLTLLASVWTTAQNDAEVRLAALRHAHIFLSAFTAKDIKVRLVDFQTILASLLVALKDVEAVIRMEALECIARISDLVTVIEEKKNAGSNVELYGYDTIYGVTNSEPLKYLDTADVSQFTKSLYKDKASFKHDPSYIHIWLRQFLTPTKSEGKRDSAYKRRILEVLFSHITCWSNHEGKLNLLDALHGIQDPSKLPSLLPLIKDLVNGNVPRLLKEDELDAYTALLFGAYDKIAFEAIEGNENNCWTLYLKGLDSGVPVVQKHIALSLQNVVFALLTESQQREVFAKLADTVANANMLLPIELRSCLNRLEAEPSAIVPILYELRNVTSSDALRSSRTKKAKLGAQGEDNNEDDASKAMAVLVEIQEAIYSRKAKVSSDLLTELFENLRLGTELLLAQKLTGEYLMQISMSNLSASLKLIPVSGNRTIPVDVLSSLRVDTVVNVIKTPCNPQTFQQALLLLSTLGGIAPEAVLHNAMPVFTFVGSTMLQRDDDYSFVVIEKTLQSILPPVMKDMATKAKGQGGLAHLRSSSSLLCVFTDAAKHVPRHRRVSFFNTLVQVMGSDYLAPICMLLIDRYSYKVAKQDDNLVDIQSTLQLPLSLFTKAEDNAVDQWSALNEIWEESHRNWTHRNEDAVELQEHVFLDCVGGLTGEHEGRRLDPIKRIVALIRFIHLAILTNSDSLEEQQSENMDEENKSETEQRKLMWNFIEHALLMSQVDNEVVRLVARDALEEMMKIAPVTILFNVTLELLNSTKIVDRRNGLHLCSKSISSMSDKDRERASSFCPKIIQQCYKLMEQDKELIGPTLHTLQTIALDCTTQEHSALSAGLSHLITLASAKNKTSHRGETLELLLVLSKHLGPRMIPQLSRIVSLSFELLSDGKLNDSIKVLVLELLTSLVRSIPVFITSHIDAIIKLYIHFPNLQDFNQSSVLLSAIVRFIAPSQLLPIIFSVWNQEEKKDSLALHITCLGLLERTIKSADKKSIMTSYKAIFKFLATVFDTRRHTIIDSQHWPLSNADLVLVEDKAVSVFLKLVLKLNESTFRPLFLRICDWALLDLVDEEEEEEDEEENGKREEIAARQIILFKVTNALLTQLGELVTNYYLNLLDGAVEILQRFEKLQVVDNEILWKQVLKSLEQSAKADKGRGSFWNENRIKAVVSSLVGQVTTNIVKNSTSCESLLGDSIAALCQTVPDESCLKMINNQLLEKTRSNQTKIKISSIRILEKVWKSKECEDTLLGLVPETVPSIAELLQESEVVVQEELGSFVAAVESVLGEGLDGYLQ